MAFYRYHPHSPRAPTIKLIVAATVLLSPVAAFTVASAAADTIHDAFPLITPAPEPQTGPATGAPKFWHAEVVREGGELKKRIVHGGAHGQDWEERGLFSDFKTFGEGIFSDIESLGSAAASVVTSAFAVETNFLAGFPTDAKAVESSLGISDSAISASPTNVLNLPNYANWTDQGWNLRFRANVYKFPNISTSQLDDLANKFLIGTSIQQLPPAQQTQCRNVTAEIFVVQQSNQNVTFELSPGTSQGASGEPGGGGGATPAGGNQTIKFPIPTTEEGDIDGFVPINGTGLSAGNATTVNQRLEVHTKGTDSGNATSFLVPPKGLTVISDIDDILRVTKIWAPKEGILNTFALPYTPWVNMPDIYANWSRSIEGLHFHYLTTTPEQVTRNYMDFIFSHYPGGSFDTRPLNFSDVSATLSIRMFLLVKIFQTFPQRKFVLVADTSNSDVMRDYPRLAHQYPSQVQCILLRNTSSTDDTDKLPYDTSGFQGLDNSTYMFFHVPDDLTNLDIASGHCVNKTVLQNVTFSEQGLPFGLSDSGCAPLLGSTWAALGWAVLAVLACWAV